MTDVAPRAGGTAVGIAPPTPLSIDRLDVIAPGAFAAAVAPLFEGARGSSVGWRWRGRSARSRRCSTRARPIAHAMPVDEQIELIDAHPRLGAPPASVSALSFAEQGYDREAHGTGAATTDRRPPSSSGSTHAYEARFGFRYCVFVAGRSRAELLPGLAAALEADRDAELARALDAVVDIARDRYATTDRGSIGGSVGDRARRRTATARPRSASSASPASPTAHRVRDLTVAIALEGDFEAAHTDGDNAHGHRHRHHEEHGLRVRQGPSRRLDRGLRPCPRRALPRGAPGRRARPSTSASTTGAAIDVAGRPAPDAFVRGGEGTRVATVTATRGGIDGRGRRRGPHRHEDHALGVQRLPARPVHDAARDRRPADGDEGHRDLALRLARRRRRRDVRRPSARRCSRSSPTTTARPSRPRSGSWPGRSSSATRRSRRSGWSCPNLHHWLVDLSPFGLENDREIYTPTTEPHGLIEATVRRGEG